ncbi:MAG: response regulator transcription factor [Bacteroidetes bacterium]|nr:response regulator transcription factor [Bacteroidota bacterium]
MVRIIIIEDHPVVINGLRNIFRPGRDGIEITGSAQTPDEATEKISSDSFDIILLDLWLENHPPPLENIKKLKAVFPEKPIVMFTSEDQYIWKRKMYEAGVKAYLLKSAEKPEIKSTLEKVAEGLTVFTGVFEQQFMAQKFNQGSASGKHQLTENQIEIVKMLSNGLTQQKIAENKKTTLSNIEKTIKHIRDSIGAKNNTELVRILVERGVI